MYAKLDWKNFMELQAKKTCPKISFPFLLDTPYLHKNFNLDLIIWNLSDNNLEITKKVVNYVLQNFNKLFETAWTALYYFLCSCAARGIAVSDEIVKHTLSEFYEKQIDFQNPNYSIELELNSAHLSDGIARYCFVVATTIVNENDTRLYMTDNKCWGTNDNNDTMQMVDNSYEKEYYDWLQNDMTNVYEKMDSEHFQYAESFKKVEVSHV